MSQTKSKKVSRQRKKKSPWPLVLLVGGGLLLIVGAIFALNRPSGTKATIEVTGAPGLKVDQEAVDLGDIKLGTTVEASFQLTNIGDKTLVFSKAPFIEVKEGCWPPVPAIGSMVLKPGETTTLSMQFMMHGDMGGKHDFRVHLPTNDTAWGDKTLAVLSNWVP